MEMFLPCLEARFPTGEVSEKMSPKLESSIWWKKFLPDFDFEISSKISLLGVYSSRRGRSFATTTPILSRQLPNSPLIWGRLHSVELAPKKHISQLASRQCCRGLMCKYGGDDG